MGKFNIFLLIFLIFMCGLGITNARLKSMHFSSCIPEQNDLKYNVEFFDQRIDHFSYVNQRLTFRQRYVISDKHWCDNCPIFLDLGGEGDIVAIANRTGFMWEMAPKFRAMVLFIEHRYYGQSVPFGMFDTIPDEVGYLTTGQALADFAEFIKFIQRTRPRAKKSPIILFGGSYAGMLAFWFRQKYPFLSIGALASSAPIFQFPPIYNCYNGYYKQTTKDYIGYSLGCAQAIRRSWPLIRNMFKTAENREFLTKTFHLCKALEEKDEDQFVDWINIIGGLAQIDYPNSTPTLPAYPVGEICKRIKNPNASPPQLLTQIYHGVSVYYNYTGDKKCYKIEGETSQIEPWVYQTCTEMVLPFCTNGITDMFEPDPWDPKKYSDDCFKEFGVRPDFDKAITMFGGFDITSVTNVIFTNGMRDPWAPGGLRHTVSPSLIAINITHAVHHEDLRFSAKNDSPALIAARQKISSIFKVWVKEYYRKIGYIPKNFQDSILLF